MGAVGSEASLPTYVQSSDGGREYAVGGPGLYPLTQAWASLAPCDPRPVPAPLWATIVLSVQKG